jgi:D-glycero-alpha-D-manno-heptose-7-phosphate kinase
MGELSMTFQPTHLSQRTIHAAAPIRICDNGGWTDTWFSGTGKIFNIAVSPHAEVQIQVFPANAKPEPVFLSAENFGDHYPVRLDQTGWGPHPLLEACIRRIGIPQDVSVHITIHSQAPSGASTGTSAAVTVALIGALYFLQGKKISPQLAAQEAHAVETEDLSRQCGIQDQICSAWGSINYIEMTNYPAANVCQLEISRETAWELERRMALVYLGRCHDSSSIHEKVIAELELAGPDNLKLTDLRVTAEKSRDALLAGDFPALGKAMIENTEAQGRLHPHLIGREAMEVIEIARSYGAIGWKVNGAGGDGGSLTILCGPDFTQKRLMLRAIEGANILYRSIPIRLDRDGLRIWET